MNNLYRRGTDLLHCPDSCPYFCTDELVLRGLPCVMITCDAGKINTCQREEFEKNFTAENVKALRNMCGSGLAECKAALREANGDMDKAIHILSHRGLTAATKERVND